MPQGPKGNQIVTELLSLSLSLVFVILTGHVILRLFFLINPCTYSVSFF